MSDVAVRQDAANGVAHFPQDISASSSLVERMLRDPTVPMDRIERAIAMTERIAAREAETAYNAAMALAQSEMQVVAKKANNPHTRSKYAALEAIHEMIRPAITKHGFAMSFGTAPSTLAGHVLMSCDVTHRDGFTRRYETPFPLDGAGAKGNVNKTDIQAIGSTMSYGRRYMTLNIFNIATGDDRDGNAPPHQVEPITADQIGTLKEMIDSIGGNIGQKFLAHYKIETLAELPLAKFDGALNGLKKAAGSS